MSTPKASKPFCYLDLPAELQLRIIHFAVKCIRTVKTNPANERTTAKLVVQPAMTRVSRSIRADALPTYYKTSTFTLRSCPADNPKAIRAWLDAIGPTNRRRIQWFELELDMSCCGIEDERFTLWRLTQWFKGMEAAVEKTVLVALTCLNEWKAAWVKSFRFLDLPAELQLRLIEFVVVKDSPICINFGAHAHTLVQDPTESEPYESRVDVQKQGHHLLPPLCQVSAVIRADAVKMYYQKNKFIVAYCGRDPDEALDQMKKWLSSLGPAGRASLRELQAVHTGITYNHSNGILTSAVCRDTYGAKELIEEMEGAAEASNEPGVYRITFASMEDKGE